jgi:tetratricopeptide (TPR) repeat protein
MTKWRRNSRIILILLIEAFTIPGTYSQDAHKTLETADSAYNVGNYSLALNEYQRLLFFHAGEIYYLQRQIGNIYFLNHDFKKAIEAYTLAFSQYSNDSIRNELVLQKCCCYIHSGNYYQALAELLNIKANQSVYFQQQMEILSGIIYFNLQDYVLAEKSLKNALPENDTLRRQKVSLLFTNVEKLNRPYPELAALLSIFIPGSGHLYAGDSKKAFLDLLIDAGFVTTGILVDSRYGTWSSVFFILPWFQGYYLKTISQAAQKSEGKRAEKRSRFYFQLAELYRKELIFP